MEIKKFESYKYKGPDLMNINREQFIQEFIDMIVDQKICGYEVNGTSYFHKTGELWLHCDKKDSDGKYTNDYKIIKLDLSDMGIEIGNAEWDDDKEEFDEFVPEVSLDTDTTKQIKKYKKDISKYNV